MRIAETPPAAGCTASIPTPTWFDVLQRISLHPDHEIEQLTPRRWKELFADDPLRSDLAVPGK